MFLFLAAGLTFQKPVQTMPNRASESAKKNSKSLSSRRRRLFPNYSMVLHSYVPFSCRWANIQKPVQTMLKPASEFAKKNSKSQFLVRFSMPRRLSPNYSMVLHSSVPVSCRRLTFQKPVQTIPKRASEFRKKNSKSQILVLFSRRRRLSNYSMVLHPYVPFSCRWANIQKPVQTMPKPAAEFAKKNSKQQGLALSSSRPRLSPNSMALHP